MSEVTETHEEGTDVALRRLASAKALFLVAAGISLALSMTLWFSGSKEQGIFVGLWVPSALALGALLTNGSHDNE